MSADPGDRQAVRDDRTRIRVLVVHPLRVERVRLIRPLRTHFGRNVAVTEATGADEARNCLTGQFFDVALVAQNLDGLRGLELAQRIADWSPETATLLLAEEDTAALAAEVAQSAACDYVVRGRIGGEKLVQAISGAIRQIHLQRDYREMVRRMNESHDQMDHLIRALSHDMNANFMLMESSFSNLERLLREPQADEVDLKEVAAHVRACMTESRRFLNDLVGLARTGRVEMEPALVETDAVVGEVLFEQRELLAERKVAVEIGKPLPRLWCNRHRLKQAITNLVRNAAKHGMDPKQPRLKIDGKSKSGGTALLRVHDNGPGIPDRWREEIFMPGRRVPGAVSDGSGMGLAIVRKIAQHYGGTVRVDSGADGGTSFEIELPSVGGVESGAKPQDGKEGFEVVPRDRRFDRDSPHEDPRLHPHRISAGQIRRGRRISDHDD